MVRYESSVSCINIKKISKIKNISKFGLEPNVRERERERERERGRGGRKTSKLLRRFYKVLPVGTWQAES